jgi:hypothetical protein
MTCTSACFRILCICNQLTLLKSVEFEKQLVPKLITTLAALYGIQTFRFTIFKAGGSGGSVGIETDYGLDCPGMESRWGRDFSHTSRPALGSTQPHV